MSSGTTMNRWYISLMVLAFSALCFYLGYSKGSSQREPAEVSHDTITIVDTITIDSLVIVEHDVIKWKKEYIPITDTLTINDTVYAVVSRERVVYQDSLYRAVISGIHPSLDSLQLFPRVTTITIREKEKAGKWHLGVQAGVGYTGKIEPYIGIGITYSLWEW